MHDHKKPEELLSFLYAGERRVSPSSDDHVVLHLSQPPVPAGLARSSRYGTPTEQARLVGPKPCLGDNSPRSDTPMTTK